VGFAPDATPALGSTHTHTFSFRQTRSDGSRLAELVESVESVELFELVELAELVESVELVELSTPELAKGPGRMRTWLDSALSDTLRRLL
jgi:hypothetical protein